MMKRVSSQQFKPTLFQTSKPCAGAALGLVMALVAGATPRHVVAAPPTQQQEESVLIATREAPPSASKTAANENALQPTAQSSDHTPELATGGETNDAAANFGDALAKVAEPTKHETPAPSATLAPINSNSAHTGGETRLPPVTSSEAKPMSEAGNGTARRAAAARAEKLPYEPVKFQGIAVGKTTKHELLTAWGPAADQSNSADGEVLVYRKAPFQAIEILVNPTSIVATIKITLATPLDSKKLAEQLSLDKIEAVTVSDESDKPIGLAFPERGVLFVYSNSDKVTPVDDDKQAEAAPKTVSHVVIQPLDPHMFSLRAEKHLHGPYAQNINDLKAAIALDPEFANAYCLLSKIYLATGQADLADAAAAEACDIEPKNASFQLCSAQARQLLGEYDDAVIKVRAVLDREDITPIEQAQALHEMGRLASLGDGEIASKTVSFETRAIEAADKLAINKDGKVRRAAKQVLVEAHVGVAEEIARQSYNQKVDSIAQWVGRASGLAEDYIAKDGGGIELRLFIAQRVLSGLASFKPTLDPAPWVAEAEESAKTLLAQSDDEMWQQHVKWELGIAYLNALRIEHTRRQTDTALKYGQLAIDNLAVGASCRQAVHSSEQLVGQLYFQMGAVYAVHKLDHAKATQWYEKAAPLLTSQRPASELYAPRREGEMLVSMGVSYWQLGNQARALDLTQTGVGLVEAAVENGVLAKSTLAVPYGNLATMYQQMGETTNAAKYADLAKSVGGSVDSKQTPHVGRNQNQKSSRK